MWSEVDERLTFQGRTTLLRESHRTGKTLAEAVHGLRISKDDGLEPIPRPHASRLGETPSLVMRPIDHHMAWLKTWWEEWSSKGRSPHDVAILCRDRSTQKAIQAELGLDSKDAEGPVRLMRKVRGPEWPVVVIPFLAASRFPSQADRERLQGDALREAMEDERSLLYVGLTRASHRAILIADPDDRSELLDYLDLSKWEVDRLDP